MKKYLWTKIDRDDDSTWPSTDSSVMVAMETKNKPGYWRQAIAQAVIYNDIKSFWNWTAVKGLYWRGSNHFVPTHWRPLLDVDFPDSEHYSEIEDES